MAMTGFRANLDAWREGKATQDDVEAALTIELATDPQLIPATRALIEAYRLAGHVPVPFAERLLNLGRSATRAPRAVPMAGAADRTILRPHAQSPDRTMLRPSTLPARTSGASPSSAMAAAGDDPGGSGPLGIGSILAGQYLLESIVPGGDRGSMAIVFKARDLIQEEAQDRNPYVAVKVLNEEFKRHPDWMKALHHEYEKALQLSHPNIAKVQTFNRDGTHVFMVMELLEGRSLGDVIVAAKDTGLPLGEALRTTLALARALGYAHRLGIVHANFKPSNAFVTGEAAIKVLDFGIARAAKRREAPAGAKRGNAEASVDAGMPGALARPYASCEQIQGADPDPRDDVYALAVVSYQLLTGRHPFDGEDAVSARNAALEPRAVPGLSRRQWGTLHSALSFSRDQRPADAEAFGDGLTPKEWPVNLLAIGGLASVLVIVAATALTSNLLERRRSDRIADELASPDPALAADAVQSLLAADIATRSAVLSQQGASNAVLAVFKRRARASFDPQLKLYDFPGALAALANAKALLPDSASLQQFRESLESEQKQELNAAGEQFERLLATHALLGKPGEPSLVSLRQRIAELDASHPLLRDSRVPIAFRDAAAAALARSDPDGAESLVRAGLQLAPNDPSLSDLADSVRRERDKFALANSIGDLERRVAPLGGPGASLTDFRNARDSMSRLRAAAPADRALAAAERRLETLVAGAIAGDLQRQNAGQAQATLGDFQPQLDPSFVRTKQAAIAEVVGEARAKELQAAQLRRDADLLLAAPRVDEAWVADLRSVLAKLGDVAPMDPEIAVAKTRAGRYLLEQARALRVASRFGEADRLLSEAGTIGVSASDIRVETDAVGRAREQLQMDNNNRALDAKLAADKQRVLDLAGAGGGRLDQAFDLYMQLLKQLSAGDPWGSGDAPKALADGFLRRAQTLAEAGKFSQAQSQARKLLNLPLKDSYYAARIEFFDRLASLQAQLQNGAVPAATAMIEELKRRDARGYQSLEPEFAAILNERIRKLTPNQTSQANALLRDAHSLFPKQYFAQPHE